MSVSIEERLPELFASVQGPADAPRDVYRRLQFVARLMRAGSRDADAAAGPRLVWLPAEAQVKALALTEGKALVIGRDATGHVVLADPRVSRRHCAITSRAGVAEIADLGSSNGTWVNGARLNAPQLLHDGDVIEIGSTAFAYFAGEAVEQ